MLESNVTFPSLHFFYIETYSKISDLWSQPGSRIIKDVFYIFYSIPGWQLGVCIASLREGLQTAVYVTERPGHSHSTRRRPQPQKLQVSACTCKMIAKNNTMYIKSLVLKT